MDVLRTEPAIKKPFKEFCEGSVNMSRPSHVDEERYLTVCSRDKAPPLRKETGI